METPGKRCLGLTPGPPKTPDSVPLTHPLRIKTQNLVVGILSRSGQFSEQGSGQKYSCARKGKTEKTIVSDKNGRQASSERDAGYGRGNEGAPSLVAGGGKETKKMVVEKKVEVKLGLNSSHSHLQKFQQAVVDFHAVAKRPKVPLSKLEEMEEEGKESDEEGSDDGESESDEDGFEGVMDTEEEGLEKASGWYWQLIYATITKLILWNLRHQTLSPLCVPFDSFLSAD